MNKFCQKISGLKVLMKFRNRFQLLINRLLFPNNGPNVYLLDELEILVDHTAGDQCGTRSCLIPGAYDPCLEMMEDLPKSINVLDLGANGGGFCLALHRFGWEIKKGVVVELNPHTYTRLALNLMRNIPDCFTKIRIINGAAASEDGEIEIHLGRGSIIDSVIASQNDGEKYRLPCISFQSLQEHFEKDEIDICKIDIEGSEYDLIKNTQASLLNRCKYLIIEIHECRDCSASELIDLIRGAGFADITTHRALIEDSVYFFKRNRVI